MKQETTQTTIADYHGQNKVPIKKYRVLQIRDSLTDRKRWGIFWFCDNGVMYERFPTVYGMRAAVRLANRLNREWGRNGRNGGNVC